MLDDFIVWNSPNLQPGASIAALPDGRFVVAFVIDGVGIFANIYSGTVLVANALAHYEPVDDPRVTVLENGNFVIAWQQGDDFAFEIHKPDGSIVGSDTISLIFPVARPEIAALAGGGFVVVGTGDDNNGDPFHFIYNDIGNPQATGADSISGHAEDDAFVFGLANGDFVNVYTNKSGGDGDAGGIFFALNDDGGDPVGPPVFLANTGLVGNESHATGVGLRDGGFVIAWADDDSGYIRGQAFDSDGQARGYEFEVGGGFATINDQVSVAEMADGRIVFTWRQDDAGDSTIHSRIFDPRQSAITLNGTGFGDKYTGTFFGDVLRGQAGDDNIHGGGGDDTIDGGADSDSLFGDIGNDLLIGGDGDDYLSGGYGHDTLVGGEGSDLYDIGDKLDTIVETATGGDDAIQTTVDINLMAIASGAFIETVSAIGATGVTLVGTSGVNTLIGFVNGAVGDTLIGGDGGDVYGVGANDFIVEGAGAAAGIDRAFSFTVSIDLTSAAHGNGNVENAYLLGSSGLSLTGTSGANELTGNIGANTITGGLGRDTMAGGPDAVMDIFDFNSVLETGKTARTRDVITDFGHLEDRIDLSTIDANGTASGDPLFAFLATRGASFTGVKGQLRWYQENKAGTLNDKTIVEGDTNGDRKVDFQIGLKGLITLSSSDFVL